MEAIVRSDIDEETRLTLQSSIISQSGKTFVCQQCHEKYHIIDLKRGCKEITEKINVINP